MGLQRDSLGFPAAPKTTAENQYLPSANHMQAGAFMSLASQYTGELSEVGIINAHFTDEETKAWGDYELAADHLSSK